jgi:hypothetical protein
LAGIEGLLGCGYTRARAGAALKAAVQGSDAELIGKVGRPCRANIHATHGEPARAGIISPATIGG